MRKDFKKWPFITNYLESKNTSVVKKMLLGVPNEAVLLRITKVHLNFTAKLREAFLFQVPNSFGIFLITFAILKNPFANPLKKVANPLMEFAMFLS